VKDPCRPKVRWQPYGAFPSFRVSGACASTTFGRRRSAPAPLSHRSPSVPALAALLLATPTSEIAERLQALLAQHNPLEEGEDGFSAVWGRLASADEDALIGRIVGAPPVSLAAHHDGPRAFASITRLLRAAGRIGA
jgi:hypothetical protein